MHRKYLLANCLLLLASTLLLAAPSLASPASEECDIANRLAHEGIWDSAVMFYEKALALNPYYMPAVAGRAAALRHMHGAGDGTARHRRKVTKKEKIAHAQATAVNRVTPATGVAPDDEALGSEPKPDTVQTANSPKAESKSKASPADSAAAPKAALSHIIPTESAAPSKSSAASAEATAEKQSDEQTPDGIRLPPSAQDSTKSPDASGDATNTDSDKIHSHTPPSWLILAACAIFAVIVVLTVWWLSPTMYAARQSQHKLKQVDRGSDEF